MGQRECVEGFRKKVDEHTDQSLVDHLGDTGKSEWRTRAQWEDLVPQAREWLDEQNPTKQVSMASQQAKMSTVEEVITTTAASAKADQRQTQDMVEGMMRMMRGKEKRKKPDTDVELEDDPLGLHHRWGANTMQELVQATADCLVYRQAESVHSREATIGCS